MQLNFWMDRATLMSTGYCFRGTTVDSLFLNVFSVISKSALITIMRLIIIIIIVVVVVVVVVIIKTYPGDLL